VAGAADVTEVAPSGNSVRKARAAAKRLAAAKQKAIAKRPAAPAPKKKALTTPKGSTCRTKRVRTKSGRVKKVRVCTPAKKRPATIKPSGVGVGTGTGGTTTAPTTFTPTPTTPGGAPAPLPPPAVPPTPAPTPSPGPLPAPPGDFTAADAQRLLWRAGFGPKPGQAQALAAMGLDAAVHSLVYPQGEAQLVGPAPKDDDGLPLAPLDIWGHDHLWWLDRMVRSDQPLVERMTLIWHDWFATSRDKVGSAKLMLDQNALLRRHALGSFADLLHDITVDPAMLVWLDGIENTRNSPNENFAREVMELFTLGAHRSAYTEQDIREAARALTGHRADWDDTLGLVNFRFDATRHDTGTKSIFGQSGNFGWADVVRLCVSHPLHASHFVTKLWSAFVPVPADEATQAHLQWLYVDRGHAIAPVVEAILKHPTFLRGPSLVKPPVVHNVGVLRTIGRPIDTMSWTWMAEATGQRLFFPPNVAGWNEDRWLDTSRWRGRWDVVATAIWDRTIDAWSETSPYSATETPEEALATVLQWCGSPLLTEEVHQGLLQFARDAIPASLPSWAQGPRRGLRMNALRMLVLTCSDLQTC